MDAISYSHSVKQEKRIKKFIADPDSNSGIVTVPKVIGAGESVTIPAGRVAVLPNVQVDGTLNIEGEVFIPSGSTFVDLEKGLMPIGTILNGYTIFDNCIVAFGGEFNRSDYPKLWAYLQANPSLLKTQTQWQTEATANGGICGFFSDGNGTTTFRVPNLDKAFLRPDSRGVASYEKGSIVALDPNLASSYSIGLANGDNNTENALKNLGFDTVQPSQYIVSTAYTTASLGGSFAYGVSRPKNIAVLPLIVAK